MRDPIFGIRNVIQLRRLDIYIFGREVGRNDRCDSSGILILERDLGEEWPTQEIRVLARYGIEAQM